MDALEAQVEFDVARRHYWHIERFKELGYEGHQAEILELSNVDWHALKDLLTKGCSLEAALDILT
jgi:hypothetical protein